MRLLQVINAAAIIGGLLFFSRWLVKRRVNKFNNDSACGSSGKAVQGSRKRRCR